MKRIFNFVKSIFSKNVEEPKKNKYLWILDPGHSIHTPGKRSHDNSFLEYEFNRDIASRVARLLWEHRISYMYSMDDYDSVKNDKKSLRMRVDKANEQAKKHNVIFLSIHANAQLLPKNGKKSAMWGGIRGVEVWCYKGSIMGNKLARMFSERLSQILNLKNRGVKESTSYYVLKHTVCPAIIIEHGFYTNYEEAKFLSKSETRERIAHIYLQIIKNIENEQDV